MLTVKVRMPLCPLCQTEMSIVRTGKGVHYRCEACGGRAVTIPQVRECFGREFAAKLLRKVNSGSGKIYRCCPFFSHGMLQFWTGELFLDACRKCNAVWFDPMEFESISRSQPVPGRETAQIAIPVEVLVREERLKAQERRQSEACPEEAWKWLPGLLRMPVELDEQPLQRPPMVTWTLCLTLFLIGMLTRTSVGAAEAFGLIPAEAGRIGGLTWVTSFFLHGGLIHLLGNIYFLFVVGDNTEDKLGRLRFGLLLLLATLAGNLLHVLAMSHSTIPAIGASGGISGVLVFYCLAFPKNRLGFLVFARYTPFVWIQVPAWAYLVFWVMLQLIGTMRQFSGLSHVSAFAHVGGAAVGVCFWYLYCKQGEAAENPTGKLKPNRS